MSEPADTLHPDTHHPDTHHPDTHPTTTRTASTRRTSAKTRWRPSPVVLAVVAIAWAVALFAERVGVGERLHQHELAATSPPGWNAVLIFLVAWQLHVAAMMLPASLPLIGRFHNASADQEHPHQVRAIFLGGYLAVWTAFGLLALLGSAGVHGVEDRWQALADRPHLIAGSVLVIAGGFQFSSLKDRCLHACRHPVAFLHAHYRRGAMGAWSLGVRHGLFCLGCCWALMLVMFAVGIANLTWMAPLALLMIYEKTAPGADRLVRPIGVALVVFGALVLVDPAWMPDLLGTPPGHHGSHIDH